MQLDRRNGFAVSLQRDRVGWGVWRRHSGLSRDSQEFDLPPPSEDE